MERITQVQAKIAEGLKREGGLDLVGVAKQYGGRICNTKRAVDLMRAKGYVSYRDGLYRLTQLGRYTVLRSDAAKAIRSVLTTPPPSPELPLNEPAPVTEDKGVFLRVTPSELRWPTAEVAKEADPIVTAAVTLDIGSLKNFPLTVSDAQELRRALNKFFGEA
jgi:hypothetical protein